MTSADVVVAGAGPAGSAAAHMLAANGVDVVVLERARFPRDKSCGDGVTSHAVDLLADMGVTYESFDGKALRTYGGLIGGPNGRIFEAEPPVAYDGKRHVCWVVPRLVLDAEIARAAVRAGAKLMENAAVTDVVCDDGKVSAVEYNDGGGTKRIATKLVIGADGAHSTVAKSLRVGQAPPRHLGYALRAYYEGVVNLKNELEIYYFDRKILPGYGWIFPVNERIANVGVGIYLGELRRSRKKLREILDDFIASVPNVAERLGCAQLIGKAIGWPLPVSTLNRQTTFDGAMLCGDAASLVDPLTGEGIYTALVSGRSAARAAINALKIGDTSTAVLRQHDKEWRAIAGPYLASGRILKNLAKSATLMNLIVRRAQENAYYASRAIGYGLGIIDRRRALRSIVMRAIFNPSFFRT